MLQIVGRFQIKACATVDGHNGPHALLPHPPQNDREIDPGVVISPPRDITIPLREPSPPP